MITQIKRQKLSYILLLTCMGFIVLLFPSEKAEAQTYNAIWITGLEASPNPMLSGVESTTITINTLEYAQWFWLYPTTMTRPTVIVWAAGRPLIATMTSEWLSGIGFWGWWFYWWFNQVGTWTHQVQWDGRDLQGSLVLPGSYLATVNVYAGAAYTFGSIVINVEERRGMALSLNPDEIYPNEAGSPVSSTVTAKVTDSNGNPLSGYQVNFETKVVESKGHEHTNTRSAGIIGGWCITDNNGKCSVNYYASTVAGIDRITASLASYPEIKDNKDITVKVPMLESLQNKPNLLPWGGTPKHKLGNNNYGTTYTRGAVYYGVEKYAKDYDLNLSPDIYLAVIDMSLPWGGLFDINGDWQPPHSLHRRGESVDFSKYYKDSSGNNIEVAFYDENGNVIEITGIIDDRKLDEKFLDKKCTRYEKEIGLIHYECPR